VGESKSEADAVWRTCLETLEVTTQLREVLSQALGLPKPAVASTESRRPTKGSAQSANPLQHQAKLKDISANLQKALQSMVQAFDEQAPTTVASPAVSARTPRAGRSSVVAGADANKSCPSSPAAATPRNLPPNSDPPGAGTSAALQAWADSGAAAAAGSEKVSLAVFEPYDLETDPEAAVLEQLRLLHAMETPALRTNMLHKLAGQLRTKVQDMQDWAGHTSKLQQDVTELRLKLAELVGGSVPPESLEKRCKELRANLVALEKAVAFAKSKVPQPAPVETPLPTPTQSEELPFLARPNVLEKLKG